MNILVNLKMYDVLGYFLPGLIFTMLGTWWLIMPIRNYFNRQSYVNLKYKSKCNYNIDGWTIPIEGVAKFIGGLVCLLTCLMTKNINEKPFHGVLYLGYIASGIVDIVNSSKAILPKGSGYLALIFAHFMEVLLLHLKQTQDLKVKIKELMAYTSNDTETDIVMETNTHYQYYRGLTSVEYHAQFLLSLTILSTCASLIMEVKFRNYLAFAIGRGVFGTIHGTWLWQMGLLTLTRDEYDPVGVYDCFLNTAYAVHLVAVLHVTILMVAVCNCQRKNNYEIKVIEPDAELNT